MALAPRIAQKKILGDLGIRIKMQALHFFDGIHGIMRNHAVTDARIIQHVQNFKMCIRDSPISGRLDDAALQVGGLVGKALGGLFTKVVRCV